LKSYRPLRPRPKAEPPEWWTSKLISTVVMTDDSLFGHVFAHMLSPREMEVTWKNGRGQWLTCRIDAKRVKQGLPLR
jgi:hypothetical protein